MTAMRQEILAIRTRQERLRELLLGHLLAATAHWPGADSLTVDDVLPGYPAAARSGRVPDGRTLLRSHPELAAEIEVFFAAH